MAKPEFDIVVIGGGAGGLVVAAGAAALGAKVAVVERHRLGGDCLWYGCVPSKTLLKSAHIAHTMRHADRWGLAPSPPQPDLAKVMARVAGVIKGIEPNDSPDRFRGLGVDVIFGNSESRVRTRSRSTDAGSPPRPSSSPPARDPRYRTSPASTRHPFSPTKPYSTCASRCPRSS